MAAFELALYAQTILWLVVLGLFLASGQASLFHPSMLYLFFHALVFVLRPMLVYYLGFDSIWRYIGIQPTEADLIKTLAVSSVALLVFVGTNTVVGRARVVYPAEPPGSFSPRQEQAFYLLSILLFPLMIWSIRNSTSGEVMGERAANGIYILTGTTGYLKDAQFVIAPMLGVWLLLRRFGWLNLLPVAVYVAYRAWCGWLRFTIIAFLLAIVMTHCWYRRRKWLPLTALLGAVPILVLFNTLGHNRDYLQDKLRGRDVVAIELDAGLSQFEKFKARADTQDFANFDYLTFLLELVPERTHTYTYGLQYLQLFTEPIPRILWKGKPAGAPVGTFDITRFGNFVGLTYSLPGDGWCSGGWTGLVITMALAGVIAGLYHRWFWRHVNHPMAAMFYINAVAMAMQWYRDGGISIAKFLFWNWLPLFLWIGMTWWLAGGRVPGGVTTLCAGDRLRLIRPGHAGPGAN